MIFFYFFFYFENLTFKGNGPYGFTTGTTTVKFMVTGYAKRTDMAGVRHTLLSSSGATTTLVSSKYRPVIDSATLT